MRGSLTRHIWHHDGRTDVPRRYRKPCAYHAFLPERLTGLHIDLPANLAADLHDAQQAIRDLDESGGGELGALARLLLRSEAVASSKIEGMQVGVRELARAEARFDLGATVGKESLSIIRAVEAVHHAVDSIHEAGSVTPDFIRAVHRLLTQSDAAWIRPGRFRDAQNWIGGNDHNPCGAAYVPPEPEHVDALIEDLCSYLRADAMPPLVQAALAHAQFETIHPFNDGNGRVGRALIHAVLRLSGTARRFVAPISVELSQHRDRYINGLVAFREGDVLGWIEQFTSATARAAAIAAEYLSAVRRLQHEWRERLASTAKPPRSDSVAWTLIELLPSHLVLTGPAAVAATGGSKPRVNLAIEHLVHAGVLEPLTTGARNRAWEPVGLLAIVERVDAR